LEEAHTGLAVHFEENIPRVEYLVCGSLRDDCHRVGGGEKEGRRRVEGGRRGKEGIGG